MDLRKIRLNSSPIKSSDDAIHRDEYEKDYSRLIQAPSFRRLQGKTQIFRLNLGDYYRTRLTHSLEVSQIAREVAQRLLNTYSFLRQQEHPGLMIDPRVVECAALAHDLGHPPFGHKGEEILNQLLWTEKGMKFEGNAQNFRILMFLEKRAESNCGLDLTASVLLGVNKYPCCLEESNHRKGIYRSEWEALVYLRQLWQIPEGCLTLEAQLMDICDDIAYSTHDLEDGIRAGKINVDRNFFEDERMISLVTEEMRNDPQLMASQEESNIYTEEFVRSELLALYEEWEALYLAYHRDLSRTNREMKTRWVHKFVNAIGILDDPAKDWKKITYVKEHKEDHALLRKMEVLKKLCSVTLVKDFRVQRNHKRSEAIITLLWDCFKDYEANYLMMPPDWLDSYEENKHKWPWERFIADYISGMTDKYAEKLYLELS